MGMPTIVFKEAASMRKRFNPNILLSTPTREIAEMLEMLFGEESWAVEDQRHWIKYFALWAENAYLESPVNVRKLQYAAAVATWLLRREIGLR